MAKDAPRIEKPCEVCGDIMYCTPRREVCSKCRRAKERDGKRMRDKAAREDQPKSVNAPRLPLSI
jgi:hypothetical protein